jgi:hypothetical protein
MHLTRPQKKATVRIRVPEVEGHNVTVTFKTPGCPGGTQEVHVPHEYFPGDVVEFPVIDIYEKHPRDGELEFLDVAEAIIPRCKIPSDKRPAAIHAADVAIDTDARVGRTAAALERVPPQVQREARGQRGAGHEAEKGAQRAGEAQALGLALRGCRGARAAVDEGGRNKLRQRGELLGRGQRGDLPQRVAEVHRHPPGNAERLHPVRPGQLEEEGQR